MVQQASEIREIEGEAEQKKPEQSCVTIGRDVLKIKSTDGDFSRFVLKCSQGAKSVVFQKNQRKKLCCKDKVGLICGKNDPSKWSDRLQKFVKLKARQNRKNPRTNA